MKTFVYLLVLLFILQIQSSLSQDWLSIKTIDHTFTNIPYELDSYTDASGNHLVLVDSGIKYYLVSYDGSIIRSTTLDNSGLHPVITGYGGKIFVLYNKSGTIYGKKSMNAGQSWSSITSITGSADNLYAVADVNGIHLVYANNQEYHLTYKRWDYSNEAWENTYQLTVPDLAENPYIDTSVSRLHVVHNKSGWTGGVNLQEKVNGSWQTMVNVEEEGERPVLATDSDYLHLFYYKSLGEKENNYEIYHTYRDLSGGDWSNDYQIEDVSYESEYRLEAVVTANNILHIIYSRKIYRSFTDETWSSEYTYGTDDSYHEQLSANGNDIYAIWVYEEGFNNYKLKLRQRDYDPLAPTNLAWTDTVNNHPKISWDYVE